MQERVWVEMLNIMIRVSFIEKVTYQERSGVVREFSGGFLREEHSRKREQLGIGLKVSVCLGFSRNTTDVDVWLGWRE